MGRAKALVVLRFLPPFSPLALKEDKSFFPILISIFNNHRKKCVYTCYFVIISIIFEKIDYLNVFFSQVAFPVFDL